MCVAWEDTAVPLAIATKFSGASGAVDYTIDLPRARAPWIRPWHGSVPAPRWLATTHYGPGVLFATKLLDSSMKMCMGVSLSKIPRLGFEHSEQRRHVVQARSDQMLDTVDQFPLAVHGEQPRADQLTALALGQVAPDHDVDDTAFVLKCDKYSAAGAWSRGRPRANDCQLLRESGGECLTGDRRILLTHSLDAYTSLGVPLGERLSPGLGLVQR